MVRAFAWDRLAIPWATFGTAEFMLLDHPPGGLPEDVLLLRAVRTAAVYRVHCRARHAEGSATPGTGALGLAALELVRGHKAATALARARAA